MQEIETNNHTLGRCTNEDVAEARKDMITKLHRTIDKTLRYGKEKMQINPTVTKALCCMWSDKTIQHIASHTCEVPNRPNMEHVWDWITDEGTKTCIKDITKPGARLMWAGTFTKNWTTNMEKMGINEATALKLARKIRKQIMHNTADIWRTRCKATHDTKEREEIMDKMRKTATEAQTLNIVGNANKTVQNACEVHKKLAAKKKWIANLEKRITKKKRERLNAQKHQFRNHFRTNTATHTGQTANPPPINETTATNTTTSRIPLKTRKRVAQLLHSSSSDNEDTPQARHTKRRSAKKAAPRKRNQIDASETTPSTTATMRNSSDQQMRKRSKDVRGEPATLPPAGGAAVGEGRRKAALG